MKVIQQDMLALKEGILFHQVNCQGIMGGGIARALALKFPGLEDAYREFISDKLRERGYRVGDEDEYGQYVTYILLGKVFLYRPDPSKPIWIANIFGQDHISSKSRMTSYDATVEAFEHIDRTAAVCNWPDVQYYFPYKMGCGLGGGDWEIYSAIIERYFPKAVICKHQ